MTKAAGGILDVADIPAMGVPLPIVANTGNGYTAGSATATVLIGGTHVVLGGTLTKSATPIVRAVVIGTLPVGTRPSQTRRVVCALGNGGPTGDQSGTTSVNIATNGDITVNAAAAALAPHTVVYLDAIMFPL